MGRKDGILPQINRWLDNRAAETLTDRELLDCFLDNGDSRAFDALMRRHGAMVYGVCRRVLGDEHAAEDVCQTTFVALARQGATIRGAAIGGWLHGVAWRLATKARRKANRASGIEMPDVPARLAGPLEQMCVRDAQALLDEELQRLPRQYREPLVLCHLQGRTRDEAAAQLGWPVRRLKLRLEQGRQLLRSRLVRRGVELTAVLATLEITRTEVPAAVLNETLPLALGLKALPPGAADLLADVVKPAWLGRSLAAAVLLAGSLMGAVAIGLSQQASDVPAGAQPAPPLADSDEPQPVHDAFGDLLPPGAIRRLGKTGQHDLHGVGGCVLVYAPDGKTVATLATGNGAGRVTIWNAATGQILRYLRPEERNLEHIVSIAYAPDGKNLATASTDKTLRLWDVSSGKEIRQMKHDVAVWSVAYAPDGKTLASGTQDGIVRLWDVAAGTEVGQLKAGQEKARFLVYLPDSKILAAAGRGSVCLFDTGTGSQLHELSTPGKIIANLAHAGTDKIFVKPVNEPMVGWDVKTGKQLPDIGVGRNSFVAFAPDGATVAHVDYQAAVVRQSATATGKELLPLKGLGKHVSSVGAYSPDGKTLALTDPFRVRLFDVATGSELKPARDGHENTVDWLSYAPDGKTLVSGDLHTLLHWDVATGRQIQVSNLYPELIRSVVPAFALAPDGKTIAVGEQGRIHLLQFGTGKVVRQLDCEGRVNAVAFAPDGRALVAGTLELQFFDLATGKLLRRCSVPGEQPAQTSCLAYAPNGKVLVVGDYGGRLRLWDPATGQEIKTVQEGGTEIRCAAFAPDGKTLVSADEAGMVRLWNAGEGRQLREFKHPHGVCSVAYAPDSKTIAAADRRGTVRLWECATGTERLVLQAPADIQARVTWSPDGRTLASGHADGTVLLWDRFGLTAGTAPLSGEQADALWSELGSDDGARAYRAMGHLVRAPEQAVPLLRRLVKPAVAADPQRIATLIEELQSPEFAVRLRASSELEKLSYQAESALRTALANRPGLEMKQRIESVLTKLDMSLSGEALRSWRAVEVLELIGTPNAKAALEMLAHGADGDLPTRAANTSLARLAQAR